jgi:tRNA pseudouridine55 synthase
MGRRRRPRGRPVDGILLLDKPLGITSNDALQQVKHLFFAQKAGHTGSLDPLADGLLPICFGNATKLSAYLLDSDKHYWVRVKLGETTTTQDAEGEVVERRPFEHISQADVEAVIPQFLGEIDQLPPMYSAVKHEGQRLYKLAREGKEVERKPRQITIHSIELTKFEPGVFEMEVHCSKGTYVRTLAEDMGEALGCGAHVIGLRRTGVGPYTTEGMVTLDQLKAMYEEDKYQMDKLLIPIDRALGNWPAIHLNADSTYYIKQGQPVLVPKAPTEGWVRLYDEDGTFLGVGEVEDDGRIAPRRLMVSGS